METRRKQAAADSSSTSANCAAVFCQNPCHPAALRRQEISPLPTSYALPLSCPHKYTHTYFNLLEAFGESLQKLQQLVQEEAGAERFGN